MNAMWGVAVKELRIFIRDRSVLALLFLLPALFVFVMTMALHGVFSESKAETLAVLIADEDGGILGREVAQAFQELPWVETLTEIDGVPATGKSAHRAVADGTVPVAVVLPPDGSSRLRQAVLQSGSRAGSETVPVEVVCDPALSPQLAGAVHAAVEPGVQRATAAIAVPELVRLLTLGRSASEAEQIRQMVHERMSASRTLFLVNRVPPHGLEVTELPNSAQQNVPAYTIFGIFFITILMGLNFAQEKRQGTFRRALTTPVSSHALILGKVLPYLGLNLLQAVVMFSIGLFIIPLVGGPPFTLSAHPEAVLILTVAVSMAALGLGFLLGSLNLSPESTILLAAVSLVIMAALAGIMVPRHIMPKAMQTVGLATPQGWALKGYLDVFVRGKGIGAILLPTAVLLGFSAVTYAVGLFRLRRLTWA